MRYQALLLKALSQVQKKLPDSVDIFKRLSILNPNKVLSQKLEGDFEDLPFVHLIEDNMKIIESQYRKINLVERREEECFAASGIPSNTLQFWQGVAKHSNFQELS